MLYESIFSYLQDAVYSGRDRSHRASSPDRKRMRTEFTPVSFYQLELGEYI